MSLKGNSNEERIWNFLISKGLNPFGVAGLMGNLDRESGLSLLTCRIPTRKYWDLRMIPTQHP
jgi:hypothetical protein